jgi:hypothetical protein
MDAIKPSTTFFPSAPGADSFSGQGRPLSVELTELFGKAGAKLRAARVSGQHLNLLGEMLGGGGAKLRYGVSAGGTAVGLIGNRYVHIPTFDELAQTVNVAGVKYAPMQNVLYDEGARRYHTVSADVALAKALETAGAQPGIATAGAARRAALAVKTISGWQQSQLQHVRAFPFQAGGALPFYLSKQATIREGPLFRMALRAQQTTMDSITSTRVARFGSGGDIPRLGLEWVGGKAIHRSYYYQREAMIDQLALALGVISQGPNGQIAGGAVRPMFPSVGVKSLLLRGEDPFGNKRAEMGEGRLIVSTLEPAEYGLFAPGKMLRKGIHHLRAAAAMPSRLVSAIRQHEMKAAGEQGLNFSRIRNSASFFLTTDIQAEQAARAHYESVLGHADAAVNLRTPMRVGYLVQGQGLSASRKELANKLIYELMGDSAVLATSRSAVRVAGHLDRFREATLSTSTSARGSYSQAYLNPLLDPTKDQALDVVKKAGQGGYVRFDKPLTFNDLAHEGLGGYLGTQSTSTGARKQLRRGENPIFDQLSITRDERVVGYTRSRGKIKFLIEKIGREDQLKRGTPIVMGSKRLGVHGFMDVGGNQGIDFLASGLEGYGPDMWSEANRLEDFGQRLYRQRGDAGLHQFVQEMEKLGSGGWSVQTNAAGEASIVAPYGANLDRYGEHWKNVAKTAETFGLSLDPESAGILPADQQKLLAKASPELRRQIEQSGGMEGLLGLRTQDVTMFGRAGQPRRGSWGKVEIRARDARMWATKRASIAGISVEQMRNPAVKSKRAMARAASLDRWMGILERPQGPSAKGLALAEWLATGDATAARWAKGPPKGLEDLKVEFLTRAQYTEKYGRRIGNLNRRSTISDLAGSSFVNQTGTEVDDTWKVITDVEGILPASRRGGTAGYNVKGLMVPSGRAISLSEDELVRMTHRGGRGGLKMGKAKAATMLHNRLISGEEIASAYEAHGAMFLTMAENALGHGGAFHRAHITPKASFFGTLSIAPSDLAPNQIALSKSNVQELLRRQGMSRGQAKRYITGMEKGHQKLMTHFKIEPMRSPFDMMAMEVKIADKAQLTMLGADKIITNPNEAIGLNSYIYQWLHRDLDYDQGVLWNFARTRKDRIIEQRELRRVAKYDKKWLEAAKQVKEYKLSGMATPIAEPAMRPIANMEQYQAAMEEAVKRAKEIHGVEITADAALRQRAYQYTLATQPEVATAAANLRWRSMAEITSDIAIGNMKRLMGPAGWQQDEEVKEALKILKGNREHLAKTRLLMRESEYMTLKKEEAEKLLGRAVDLADLADPKLATSVHVAGTLKGAALNKVKQEIAENMVSVLEGSVSDAGQVMMAMSGIKPEMLAAMTPEARRAAYLKEAQPIAEVLAALSKVVQHGVYAGHESVMSRGNTGIVGNIFEHIAALFGRTTQAVPGVADATGAGVLMAGATEYAGEVARNGTKTMTQRAVEAAAKGKDLLKRLMGSKWGMPVALGVGGVAAFAMGRALFGTSRTAYAPMGSPMPPNPILQGVSEDRSVDYNEIPIENYARVQRVNQVRTHMQISGTHNNAAAFLGATDSVYMKAGRIPSHSGQFIDTGQGMADHERVQEMVRRRMMNDHA